MLPDILAAKRTYVTERKKSVSLEQLEAQIVRTPYPRGFQQALQKTESEGRAALITEIKKASPSRGLIRPDFSPAIIAKAYQEAGATCLSVLTDTPYFQGKDEDLMEARSAVPLPILRKDFMVDPYQVAEARAMGADCILLIMAAVDIPLARELEAAAALYGLDVLIEVHDEAELEDALSYLASQLIGVNNRNLSTLEIDLNTAPRLAQRIPSTCTVVCESGIKTAADIQFMRQRNINCFLIGESLLLEEDIGAATRALLKEETA